MIVGNSSTVMDGLILSTDINNPKSYSGPPISNVLQGITTSSVYDNGSTYRAFSGLEEVYIPSYGTVKDCKFVDWYNDYNGGSGNCCPNMYSFGSPSLTGNTLYTYGILYRSVNRYTNPNLMYHYEYSPSGYITEFGVHNAGYSWQETHLGNGWYWSRAKFTTNASTTYGNFYSFMYQYATWNRLYVAAVALMPGDYTELHPKYWPAVGSSRANTACLYDLTGNNTLTANNLVYDTSGSFSFNGSNSVITSPNNTLFDTQSPSVEVWVKTNALNQSGFWFEKGSVNTEYSLFQEGSSIVWRQGGSSQYTTTANYITTSSWAHIVGTYTPGSRKTYINGTLVTSDTASSSVGVNSNGITIGSYNSGGYFYNGSIGVVRVYNRALTANEVKQNFNATRGRYGI